MKILIVNYWKESDQARYPTLAKLQSVLSLPTRIECLFNIAGKLLHPD